MPTTSRQRVSSRGLIRSLHKPVPGIIRRILGQKEEGAVRERKSWAVPEGRKSSYTTNSRFVTGEYKSVGEDENQHIRKRGMETKAAEPFKIFQGTKVKGREGGKK